MEFFTKEICEKFVEKGCKTESGFGWSVYIEPICMKDAVHFVFRTGFEIQAFTPWDFLGTSAQALKNAKIIFEEKTIEILHPDKIKYFEWKADEYHRHAAIDSPDAVAYIM